MLELHDRESWREVNAWKSKRDKGQKKGVTFECWLSSETWDLQRDAEVACSEQTRSDVYVEAHI